MSRSMVVGLCSCALTLGLVLATGAAHADRRSFAVALDTDLQTEGSLEVGVASTHIPDGLSPWAGTATLRYGLSRRWDVTFAQSLVSGQLAPGTAPIIGVGDTALALRFLPALRGDLPVDSRVELSLSKSAANCTITAAPMISLGRNLWKLRLVGNVSADVQTTIGDASLDCGHGTKTDVHTAGVWAAGARARVRASLDVGVEVFGRMTDVLKKDDRVSLAWVGPAISWSPSPRLWATVGAGFSLTNAADDVVVNLLLGFEP